MKQNKNVFEEELWKMIYGMRKSDDHEENVAYARIGHDCKSLHRHSKCYK